MYTGHRYIYFVFQLYTHVISVFTPRRQRLSVYLRVSQYLYTLNEEYITYRNVQRQSKDAVRITIKFKDFKASNPHWRATTVNMEGRVAWKSADDQMNRVPRSIDDGTSYVQELNGQYDFILELVFGNLSFRSW